MAIITLLTDSYVAAAIAGIGFTCLPISQVVRRRTRDPERGYSLENQIQVIGCCLLISGILLSSGALNGSLVALVIVFLAGSALMNGLAAYQAIKETFVMPSYSIGAADRALTVGAIASCGLPFAAAGILALA